MTTTDLLTPREAADMLGLEPRSLARWADAQQLETARTLGGHRRYRRRDIEAAAAVLAAGEPTPGCEMP